MYVVTTLIKGNLYLVICETSWKIMDFCHFGKVGTQSLTLFFSVQLCSNFHPSMTHPNPTQYLLDQGSLCGATDCPYFGLCVTLPMGFKARVVL